MVSEKVLEDFFASLENSKDVDAEMVQGLKAFLESDSKLKADDLMAVFEGK